MRRRPLKAIKNGLIFGLVALIYAALNALPLGAARRLGAGLGRLFFVLVPYERKKTLKQLELAFPEMSGPARYAVGKGVFGSLGRGAAEFMRFPRYSMKELEAWISRVDGWEHMQAAYDLRKGVVAVTAHVGHWELLAAYTASRTRVAVVARQAYDERLDNKLNQFRADKGVTVFARNSSVKPILRWLKDGGVLGVLCDQDTGVDSVYVDFFGHEAKTPSGAAWLAAMTGAAIVTAFSAREFDGRYRLEYQPPIHIGTEATRDKRALRPVVQEYTRRTEAFIREVPEQWAWNHSRWRSKKSEASSGWDPSEA